MDKPDKVAVNLNIDGDAINAAVTQAIVDSMLGQKIKDSIGEAIQRMFGWHGEMDKVVEDVVRRELSRSLREDFGSVIEERVRERLTQETLDGVVSAIVDKMLNADL